MTWVDPFKFNFVPSYELQRIARSGTTFAEKLAAKKELEKREKK